jgi:hypothetical protein
MAIGHIAAQPSVAASVMILKFNHLNFSIRTQQTPRFRRAVASIPPHGWENVATARISRYFANNSASV